MLPKGVSFKNFLIRKVWLTFVEIAVRGCLMLARSRIPGAEESRGSGGTFDTLAGCHFTARQSSTDHVLKIGIKGTTLVVKCSVSPP